MLGKMLVYICKDIAGCDISTINVQGDDITTHRYIRKFRKACKIRLLNLYGWFTKKGPPFYCVKCYFPPFVAYWFPYSFNPTASL